MRSGIKPERSRRVFFLIPIEKTKRSSAVLPLLGKILEMREIHPAGMFDDQGALFEQHVPFIYAVDHPFKILHSHVVECIGENNIRSGIRFFQIIENVTFKSVNPHSQFL